MKSDLSKVISDQSESVSQVLKSLSHPVRLKVLCHVIEQERTVTELTEFCGISQSAMSQFLGRMKDEGILESRRVWNQVYYQIADPKLIRLLRALKEIYC